MITYMILRTLLVTGFVLVAPLLSFYLFARALHKGVRPLGRLVLLLCSLALMAGALFIFGNL